MTGAGEETRGQHAELEQLRAAERERIGYGITCDFCGANLPRVRARYHASGGEVLGVDTVACPQCMSAALWRSRSEWRAERIVEIEKERDAALAAIAAVRALPVPDGPKMLRETLCVAQSAISHAHVGPGLYGHLARLGRLIDAIDVLRPLGPDGKHGDRHTSACGCEDKSGASR